MSIFQKADETGLSGKFLTALQGRLVERGVRHRGGGHLRGYSNTAGRSESTTELR